MDSDDRVEVEFVESIPPSLQPQKLYVSIRYRTTAHLCMCGCGHKVVHPLRPHRWSLTYDGVTISVAPSIANDGLPCNSHYWIRKSRVDWYRPLTSRQIEYARAKDAGLPDSDLPETDVAAAPNSTELPRRTGWRARLRRRRRGNSD